MGFEYSGLELRHRVGPEVMDRPPKLQKVRTFLSAHKATDVCQCQTDFLPVEPPQPKKVKYDGQKNGPSKMPCPNPQTCEHVTLFGKRNLAVTIKFC